MLKESKCLTDLEYGFTLIELLITIAVLMIALSIALPTLLQNFINTEARTTRQTITSVINHAKATSYSEHQRVFMCLLNIDSVCDKNGDEHLILFVDKNNNSQFDENIDRLIIKKALSLKYAYVAMRAGRRNYVRFSADSGTPRGFMGHFKYCPIHIKNINKYQVSFNMVGNIRHKPDDIHPTDC